MASLAKAMNTVRKFNREGIFCSLAHLPALNVSHRTVMFEVRQFGRMLSAITANHLDCDITVKMQQFGIYRDEALARASVESVVRDAAAKNIFVWIDMERPETVDATIRIFRSLHERYRHCGICLQAYLERTTLDVRQLLADATPIRLVKGFYREHDIPRWSAVTRNYDEIMHSVLTQSDYPAIATHDLDLVARAKGLIRQHAIRNAEFQFFQGIRDDVARELVSEGFRVRIYVPFGNVWRFLLHGVSSFDIWHQVQRMAGMKPRA
jgi:proline dehydrogenase